MHVRPRFNSIRRIAAGAAALAAAALAVTPAVAQEPIKIGFGMSLTGGLAPNGKSRAACSAVR